MRATIKPLLTIPGGPMGILSTLAQSSYYDDPSLYYTTTSSTTTSSESAAAAAAALAFLLVFALIFALVAYVITAFCLMRIFKKAGIEQWPAWVPIYNNWKLLEIGGQQGFWAILSIIPIVNIAAAIFMYIAMYNIGLKLQKEGIFVLVGIIAAPVWLIWLAFDKSVWDESKGAPSLARRTEAAPTPTVTPPTAPTV